VATMQAINERIQNPAFVASFFGAALFLIASLVVYSPRPRSGRFWLIALAWGGEVDLRDQDHDRATDRYDIAVTGGANNVRIDRR
jgi:hypothetical protein